MGRSSRSSSASPTTTGARWANASTPTSSSRAVSPTAPTPATTCSPSTWRWSRSRGYAYSQLVDRLRRLPPRARPGDPAPRGMDLEHRVRAVRRRSTTSRHEPVAVAPRSILRRQLAELADAGFTAAAASELEFFLFRDSYRGAHEKGYRDLESAGWYVEDYHLLQASRVEDYVGAARRALRDSGIPVENSKGEAAIGQHELNVRYADALDDGRPPRGDEAGDEGARRRPGRERHLHGQARRGPARQFSCHIHLSLWDGRRRTRSSATTRRPQRRVPLVPRRLDAPRRRPDGLLRTDRQQLQALPEPVVGADPDRLVDRQPDRRLPHRRHRRRPADREPHPRRRRQPVPRLRRGASPADSTASATGSSRRRSSGATSTRPPTVPTVPGTLHEANARFVTSADARRLLGDDVVDHYGHHFSPGDRGGRRGGHRLGDAPLLRTHLRKPAAGIAHFLTVGR